MPQRPAYIGKHFGRNNRSNTFRAPPAFVAANPFPRTHYTEGLREPYSSIYYPSSNPYPQINPYAYRQNPVYSEQPLINNKTRKLRKPPPIPTQGPPIQLPPAPTRPAPPPPTEEILTPPIIPASPGVVPPINPIQTTLPGQLRVVKKVLNPTPISIVTPPPSQGTSVVTPSPSQGTTVVTPPSQGTPAMANNRPGISGQLTHRQNVSKQTLNNVRAARERALAKIKATNALKAAELEKARLAAAERQRIIREDLERQKIAAQAAATERARQALEIERAALAQKQKNASNAAEKKRLRKEQQEKDAQQKQLEQTQQDLAAKAAAAEAKAAEERRLYKEARKIAKQNILKALKAKSPESVSGLTTQSNVSSRTNIPKFRYSRTQKRMVPISFPVRNKPIIPTRKRVQTTTATTTAATTTKTIGRSCKRWKCTRKSR
jgi:hypothetical protein